jgi:radical SAM protein with 4Fe4S-binding SPASM domain
MRITVQIIEQQDNRHQIEEFKQYWLDKGAVVKVRPRLGWGKGVDAPELVMEQDQRVGPCPWLVRTVSIHWNGTVVQCDGDWDQRWPVGDLNRQTLEEVWLGELAKRRELHRSHDFDFDPCRNCKDWQAGLSEFYFPKEKSKDR